MDNPSRILSADKAAFFLNPKRNKVLVPPGSKNVCQIVNNDEKECLTVFINCSASGEIAPPMIVFIYEGSTIRLVNRKIRQWVDKWIRPVSTNGCCNF